MVIFPTTFPKQAVAELLALTLSPDKPSPSTLALSVYDLVGFALFKAYGPAVYPVGSFNLSNIEKILNLPAFQNAGQVLTDFNALVASGKSRGQAILALTVKYGPGLAETILEILSLTGA